MKTFIYLCIFASCFIIEAKAEQKLWSNPTTWGGTKPSLNASVIIPTNDTIILDEDPPALAGITINGVLIFARQNIQLTASWILVHGELQIGSTQQPFTQKAVITLTADNMNENIMGMGTRGIMVMGGRLELHGAVSNRYYTKLNNNAFTGSVTLTLADTVDWNLSDQIIISPTDYFGAANGNSITQRTTLTSKNGVTIGIANGLNAARWGRLQYVTANGLSLTPGNLVNSPLPDSINKITPRVLDERAIVANLSRNIIIQSTNDVLWNNFGFGVHIMLMGSNATAHVEGIEIRRAGQRGSLGRYPFHWHMLSYSGTQTLADATGQYIRNSSINSSRNRGIVIHGTNGVTVQNNVVYDVLGHGIFTEDAVERRNIIDGNIVMLVRNPPLPGLKLHEVSERGSSGFWISNPDNTITNNIAADCGTNGFWLAFPRQPWGESSSVLHSDGLLLNPSRLRFGVFENNTAFSNAKEGIMLDFVESDNDGNVMPHQYQSTSNGRDVTWNSGTLERFTLKGYKTWKNGSNGIWDRGAWANNFEVVSADNCGRYFAGSGADGIIERSLVIGTSLNHMLNNTDRPQFNDVQGGNQTPAAFATYHSAFDIKNNIVVNFPAVYETRSGAFATEDYYIRPVEKGHIRNTNNLLINSHPGVKLKAIFPYFALASAMLDPHGTWGTQNAGKYFVYNSPFFTYNQNPTIGPQGDTSGGVFVNGPFYGFNDFILNKANLPYEDYMEINVRRVDSNREIVGVWNISSAVRGNLLDHMRHFSTHHSGQYILEFPGIDTVSDIAMTVENMLTPNDTVVLAVEYSGAYAVSQVYTSSFPNFMNSIHEQWIPNPPSPTDIKQVYKAVNSYEEVLAASGGGVYWHDRCSNLVWIKIKGGIQQVWNDNQYSPISDERLYRLFNLRIFGTPDSTPLPIVNASVNVIGQTIYAIDTTTKNYQWYNCTTNQIIPNENGSSFTPTVSGEYALIVANGNCIDTSTCVNMLIVNVEGLKNSQYYKIYPNPSKGNYFIDINNVTSASIKVYDYLGRLLFNEHNVTNYKLDLNGYSNGIYVVELELDGLTYREKLLKL